MNKFCIDKKYYPLIGMLIGTVLLIVLFVIIFKGIFRISTWHDIKQVLEVFRSLGL